MKYAALIALAGASDIMEAADYKFMEFVTREGKSYGTKAEYEFRAALFKESLQFVETHNASNETHEVEINSMSDWTT